MDFKCWYQAFSTFINLTLAASTTSHWGDIVVIDGFHDANMHVFS